METANHILYVVDLCLAVYFLFQDDWEKATFFNVAALVVK